MNIQQFYLLKIAEEASEIAQAALKAMQFGLLEVNPASGESNGLRLHKELTDLAAMVYELHANTADIEFTHVIIPEEFEAKRAKVDHYLEYSHSLGLVEK